MLAVAILMAAGSLLMGLLSFAVGVPVAPTEGSGMNTLLTAPYGEVKEEER